MLRACPNLQALDFNLGSYRHLRWLPRTIEILKISASHKFTADDWLSFLEKQGDTLSLRNISPIYRDDYVAPSLWCSGHKEDDFKEAFARRGIRVSGGIIVRRNQYTGHWYRYSYYDAV
jgi:hypothetical protein